MKAAEDCKVGIVGLGLMGGAFAMALKNCGAVRVENIYAFDTNEEVLREALKTNTAGKVFSSPGEMIPLCDLVFLCINPSAVLEFMDKWMDRFAPGTLITDIAGTKQNIAAAMEKTLRGDLDFIPGHPMAGSEKAGFSCARFCDFNGRNYILTPLERSRSENVGFLTGLIRRMGFARVTVTTAKEHDSKIAFTSQLCHVIAAALVDCENDLRITRYGGGSFEDLTRIAMLNAPMWTELFIENKNELLERIDQFEDSLGKLKNFIRDGDRDTLCGTLSLIRDRRIAMSAQQEMNGQQN